MSAVPLRALVAAGLIAAGVPAAAQLRVDKRADLAAPLVLGPGQAAIVVGFRRPDAASMGKSATVNFVRYDLARRDMTPQPADARKSGDTTTYWIEARSGVKTLAVDYAVMVVSAGAYALHSGFPGADPQLTTTFCLGAPVFEAKAGEVVYFGDVAPYLNVKLIDGRHIAALAYSSHVDDARRGLAAQPALAERLRAANLFNRATFSCSAMTMNAYLVPGAADLPAADAPSTPQTTAAH